MAEDQDANASVASGSTHESGQTAATPSFLVECRRYTDLELARSAYDNFLLSFLKSQTGRIYMKPWWLLVLNFLAQYVVVYLLWQKINGSERDADVVLLDRFGGEETSLCFEVTATDGPYNPGRSGLSCSSDEVVLLTNFSLLDLDGDGHWTYDEAERLDAQYASTTRRHVDMSSVYQRVFKAFQANADGLVLPCEIHDTLEAFWADDGFWYDARLEAIDSGDYALVWYFDDNDTSYVQKSQLRKAQGDWYFKCSLPKCIDTDAGALDKEGSTCADYETFFGECGKDRYDDADFHLEKLCCLCGGGTTSLTLAGIGHLPVNVSIDQMTQPAQPGKPESGYRSCVQEAQSSRSQAACVREFTFFPKALYEKELAPFVAFCLLPDADLCGSVEGDKMPIYWNHSVPFSKPVLFQELGIDRLSDINTVEICRRTVTSFCPKLFTIQTNHFKEERSDVCGAKSSRIEGKRRTVAYEASTLYNDPKFGLTSMKFRMFLLLIVFLWGLAAVEETRLILIWWNVLLTLPTRQKGEHCIMGKVEDEHGEDELEVCGIHRRSRIINILLNLGPRSVLQCLIFYVGIKYLLSVRNVSDLILNSLALTFLVTVDEMLFEAFASETDAALLRRCKPVHGWSIACVDRILKRTRSTVGLWIFTPILIVICFFVIEDSADTVKKARATFCLCDILGEDCIGHQLKRVLLSGLSD